jgi:hypothetical protein
MILRSIKSQTALPSIYKCIVFISFPILHVLFVFELVWFNWKFAYFWGHQQLNCFSRISQNFSVFFKNKLHHICLLGNAFQQTKNEQNRNFEHNKNAYTNQLQDINDINFCVATVQPTQCDQITSPPPPPAVQSKHALLVLSHKLWKAKILKIWTFKLLEYYPVYESIRNFGRVYILINGSEVTKVCANEAFINLYSFI